MERRGGAGGAERRGGAGAVERRGGSRPSALVLLITALVVWMIPSVVDYLLWTSNRGG